MEIVDFDARDYIDIDSTLEATQIIDDNKIVNAVQETAKHEETEKGNGPIDCTAIEWFKRK